MAEGNAFSLLCRPIRKLIEERGFTKPTEPQEKAIPLILRGENVLLISPTATGKTEAAVLPILHQLIVRGDRTPGIKILYITPLRALNRDLLDRLIWWCRRLDVRLAVRHGDTETAERSRQARSPPEMLITTPETMQSILAGWIMRRHLRAVRWVIVDEVHELADNKRGSQLSLTLERLRWVTGADFQVIGLSATIGSPEKVASFLVGNGRDAKIVDVTLTREMKLEVIYPQPEPADYELAARLYTRPEVAARLRLMRELLKGIRSALLFTNTRAISEVLASRFKVWDLDFPVSIHHGSLAKPSRIAAEQGLKEGGLKGLICTSSLELGIDVGRIDLVIQYMSPRQVTRLVQRVGRSGHRIGRIARGVIITMDSDDTLEAMAICRKAYDGELEEVEIPEKPYDVLLNQLVAMLIQKRRWYFYEILKILKNSYPYRDLEEDDLRAVAEYMHTRFPRLAWVSLRDTVIMKPRRTRDMYQYFFNKLSMIPDEKNYLVINDVDDTPIGILHEAFVAEYGEPGIKFILRGAPWQILTISEDRIYVKPVDDPTGAIPSWVGEEIPVPYEVALEVGQIRRLVEEGLGAGRSLDEVVSELARRYPAGKDTVRLALSETVRQIKGGYPVPTDRRVVVEEWQGFVVVSAHFGSLVNRTLSRLIGYVLGEELGRTMAVQQDPYRIIIQTMGEAGADEVVQTVHRLVNMEEEEIVDRIVKAVSRTGLFKRRMVHVARRFGALARWADFSRVSLGKLVRSFEGTAIYDETVKDVLRKDVDVRHTLEVLDGIRKGEIEIVRVEGRREALTPISMLGVERVGKRADIIPPEKMRYILLESTRARVLNEVRTFVCTECGHTRMMRIKDLPDVVKCPECGSLRIGILSEPRDAVEAMAEKRGRGLTKGERRLWDRAKRTAELIEGYGKVAAAILVGKRLRPEDAEAILWEEDRLSDRLFELIMDAERRAMRRRFW